MRRNVHKNVCEKEKKRRTHKERKGRNRNIYIFITISRRCLTIPEEDDDLCRTIYEHIYLIYVKMFHNFQLRE